MPVGGEGTVVQMAEGVQAVLARQKTMGVEFQCERFKVTFDGETVIDVTDGRLAEARKVGLWTKAPSVAVFDHFSCGGK